MIDAQKEFRSIWLAIAVMALAVLVLTTGCASSKPVVKYERVEVPQPYWSPPTNVATLPDKPWYEVPHITSTDAAADPAKALAKIGEDLAMCLADSEHVRFLYDELVRLITEAPTPPPP